MCAVQQLSHHSNIICWQHSIKHRLRSTPSNTLLWQHVTSIGLIPTTAEIKQQQQTTTTTNNYKKQTTAASAAADNEAYSWKANQQLTVKNNDKIRVNQKYVLSNSESVRSNFFIFDHVAFIQFKICCCVQYFMKIRWFFAEIWQYIDCQNGGRPPSWNCFTTIQDYPRSLCCWKQLPVRFHVNLIHRSEDIAIWIFCIFGLKCLFRPPNWKFWGYFGPLNVIIPHRDSQKAHPCVNPHLLSYQL